MIPCRFVHTSPKEGTPDALNRVVYMPTVPRVGEKLLFNGPEATGVHDVVRSVSYAFSEMQFTEIIVTYDSENSAG